MTNESSSTACPSPPKPHTTAYRIAPSVKKARKRFIRLKRAVKEGLNRRSRNGVRDILKDFSFADPEFRKVSKSLF